MSGEAASFNDDSKNKHINRISSPGMPPRHYDITQVPSPKKDELTAEITDASMGAGDAVGTFRLTGIEGDAPSIDIEAHDAPHIDGPLMRQAIPAIMREAGLGSVELGETNVAQEKFEGVFQDNVLEIRREPDQL